MGKVIMLLATLLSFNLHASTNLVCFGTEPFWSAGITEKTISFDLIGEGEVHDEIISKINAVNTSNDFVFVAKGKVSNATIITGECNDGMSDVIYPKHIVYSSGNKVLYGCCKNFGDK